MENKVNLSSNIVVILRLWQWMTFHKKEWIDAVGNTKKELVKKFKNLVFVLLPLGKAQI